MLVTLITSVVNASRRFAVLVILAVFALSAACGWYTANNVKINTDVNKLLSENLPWRQQEKALETAFPQKVDTLVVVIDGRTADETEAAATKLADALTAMPQNFISVTRPDAIPFFRKNGLLFLSKQELSATLDQMVQAQPLIAMLATDPSLRGLCGMLGLMAQGFEAGQVDYAKLDKPFAKMAETIQAALKGEDKPLDLKSLGDETPPSPHDLRKYIITKPVLNYGELQSGKAASDAIRNAAEILKLTPGNGITVRLTGTVALNDEEFASVAEGTGTATLVSVILVITLLLLAMRSLRIVVPILLTLTCGLVATSAFAIAAIGSLNMISVAFAVMFIGIAVDFGIQFGIRYRDQHHEQPDNALAMSRTAQIIAVPLSMAAASTALGFLAFIPTAYKGVSELGMIAGAGMIIAFILNITLLPALLAIFKPPAEPEAIGYQWAAPLDNFIQKQRRAILAIALLLALGGIALTTRLHFDFDPLNLKDPSTESVSTMFDVMNDPDSDAYSIEILRPGMSEVTTLSAQVSQLPQVDHVMSLASFIPDDQESKLALINDTRTLLDSSLGLPAQPPPSADDDRAAMQKLATQLHALPGNHGSAEWLATELDEAAASPDEKLFERLRANLITVMQTHVEMIKEVLKPEPITFDNISDGVRRDWVTSDGRYLLQIHPKGNPRDHETLVNFTKAVRDIAPDTAGTPISIQESGKTVTSAFREAGFYAFVSIALLSFMVLRKIRDVLILLAPLILAGVLTLATIVAIGLPLNFANIIALPLLLSLGVSYAIYFVSFSPSGHIGILQSSMARAVLFSAATVLVAFGSLALSSHPGTAGMGKLLTVSLLYSLLSTFIVLPALLGRYKHDR